MECKCDKCTNTVDFKESPEEIQAQISDAYEPPRSAYDMLQDLLDGGYKLTSEEVQKKLEDIQDLINDADDKVIYLQKDCEDFSADQIQLELGEISKMLY